MFNHNYYVYIMTNINKTTLYIGVTNNLKRRLSQHYNNQGNKQTFAGRYNCFNLVYFEHYTDINQAIQREKQLKKWSREKKEGLITKMNPKWDFFNDEFMEL